MSDSGQFWGDFKVDEELLGLTDECSATQILQLPTQSLFQEGKLEDTVNNGRFGAPITSEDFVEKMKERMPLATRKNTKWAVQVWNDWLNHRANLPETWLEPVPLPFDLATAPLTSIDFWMSRFVMEIRRKDKNPYPPNTLVQIASSLQRHIKDELGRADVNIYTKTDPTFDKFRKALDARMKELTAEGVGIHAKKKEPVLEKDAEEMWNKGIFNPDTAEGLSNTVFFYNCKAFGFRGVHEHITLQADQFSIEEDPASGLEYIRYQGCVTKNTSGGLNQRHVLPKEVKHFEDKENGRCLVPIYKLYLSCIPRKGHFYRRPLPASDQFNYPRFSVATISQKDLGNMMRTLFQAAGIDLSNRDISNHSGRVSCCTTLYNKGFDDKAVSSCSWHRSSAVNTYKRELTPMLQDISNALAPPKLGIAAKKSPTPPKPEIPAKNTEVSSKSGTTSDNKPEATPDSCPAGSGGENEHTMTIFIPSTIQTVVIVKGEKRVKVGI